MIKVIICDDHQLMRQGLNLILEGIEEVEVVGQCKNGQEAIDWLSTNSADVILMDINMPVLDGIKATKIITKSHPEISVVYLSMINQVEIFQVLLESGAKGFLLKNSSAEEVQEAITKVCEGETYFGAELFTQSTQGRASRPKSFIPKLTKREKEILKLIVEENTSPEIAKMLYISVGTVETHRRNLISKLGVKNAAGLVRMALEYKLI